MKKVLYLLFFSVFIPSAFAQFDQEDNQWWVGLKSGINKTKVRVSDEYTILSFTNNVATSKNYNLKYGLGYQVGGIVAWDFYYNFNLSVQPYFANHKYVYEYEAKWESDINSLIIKDNHFQSVNFLNIPVLLRYEIRLPKFKGGSSFGSVAYKPIITSHSDITPYLQAGISYTRLLTSSKNIQRVETVNSFSSAPEEELINTKNLTNKGGLDYVFGAGVSYDIAGSFRVALDAVYKIGSQNLTNQKNRFSNEKLTQKYFDAPDDIKLNSWQVNLHFLFPLKFIYSANYRSI